MTGKAEWLAGLKIGDLVTMACEDNAIETPARIANTENGLICLENGRRFTQADGHEISSRWNRHFLKIGKAASESCPGKKGEAMTIDEFLQRLSIRPVSIGDLHGASIEEDLRALVYAETERCIAVLRGYAEPMVKSEATFGIIADDLLATSPGKGDG